MSQITLTYGTFSKELVDFQRGSAICDMPYDFWEVPKKKT
jgi:hypothetical protein